MISFLFLIFVSSETYRTITIDELLLGKWLISATEYSLKDEKTQYNYSYAINITDLVNPPTGEIGGGLYRVLEDESMEYIFNVTLLFDQDAHMSFKVLIGDEDRYDDLAEMHITSGKTGIKSSSGSFYDKNISYSVTAFSYHSIELTISNKHTQTVTLYRIKMLDYQKFQPKTGGFNYSSLIVLVGALIWGARKMKQIESEEEDQNEKSDAPKEANDDQKAKSE